MADETTVVEWLDCLCCHPMNSFGSVEYEGKNFSDTVEGEYSSVHNESSTEDGRLALGFPGYYERFRQLDRTTDFTLSSSSGTDPVEVITRTGSLTRLFRYNDVFDDSDRDYQFTGVVDYSIVQTKPAIQVNDCASGSEVTRPSYINFSESINYSMTNDGVWFTLGTDNGGWDEATNTTGSSPDNDTRATPPTGACWLGTFSNTSSSSSAHFNGDFDNDVGGGNGITTFQGVDLLTWTTVETAALANLAASTTINPSSSNRDSYYELRGRDCEEFDSNGDLTGVITRVDAIPHFVDIKSRRFRIKFPEDPDDGTWRLIEYNWIKTNIDTLVEEEVVGGSIEIEITSQSIPLSDPSRLSSWIDYPLEDGFSHALILTRYKVHRSGAWINNPI